MEKDDIRYVGHMVDCARQIELYLGGKSRPDFDADEVLRLAVIHLIQTIGEAARLVSSEFRQEHSVVPWSAVPVELIRQPTSCQGANEGDTLASGVSEVKNRVGNRGEVIILSEFIRTSDVLKPELLRSQRVDERPFVTRP